MQQSERRFSVLLSVLVASIVWIGFVAAAGAVEIELSSDRYMVLDIKGDDVFHYMSLSDFLLDDTGERMGEQGTGGLYHRFRLTPSLRLGRRVRFVAQADFAMVDSPYGFEKVLGVARDSYFSPILPQVSGVRWADFRQLYVSWRSPVGLLRIGQQTSDWGLGIIANSGQRATGEFGMPRFGDLVLRASWALPIIGLIRRHPIARRFILAAAFDVVYRDETADLLQNDFALQGAFSFFYKDKEDVFLGIYVAVRDQQTRNGTHIEAQMFDVHAKLRHRFDDNGTILNVAGEIAILQGKTDQLLNENARTSTILSSVGAVGRGGVTLSKVGLRFGFEVGYASGDNNLDDTYSRSFRFDPNYQPSLILFKRLLGAISARGYDRLADAGRVGVAPPGSELVPSVGRVQNALYIQPVIAYRPFSRNDILRKLELKVGLLYALSVVDFLDPFNTFRNGGVNTTPMDLLAAERHELGFELNVSLSYSYRILKSVSFGLSLLYGRFFPGDALHDVNGHADAIDVFQCRTYLHF